MYYVSRMPAAMTSLSLVKVAVALRNCILSIEVPGFNLKPINESPALVQTVRAQSSNDVINQTGVCAREDRTIKSRQPSGTTIDVDVAIAVCFQISSNGSIILYPQSNRRLGQGRHCIALSNRQFGKYLRCGIDERCFS